MTMMTSSSAFPVTASCNILSPGIIKVPLARSRTAAVVWDTNWLPNDLLIVASGDGDKKVVIWNVVGLAIDTWGQMGWFPRDFVSAL